MASIEEVREQRLEKITLMREQGINPYPTESHRTHSGEEFIANQETLIQNNEAVTLAGRITSIRDQGGSVFVDLNDGTQKVQTYFKKDSMDETSFTQFGTFVDIGDFIEVSGTAFITKRGAPSVLAEGWRMLAKSLRPIPDDYFGLKDEDERFRKRYLDMISNQDVADIVRKRSVFWNSIRAFMLKRGFLEVETPILETKASGARAKQFVAHHNALDIDVYLRISPELWHKRLMIGGIPKVFEVGRVFRNEGMSYEHAQDYTVLEFYEAYQDSKAGLIMVMELCRYAAEKTFSTSQFSINGFEVDLKTEWKTLNFNDLMQEKYNFDPREVSLDEVKKSLEMQSINYERDLDLKHGIDLLWACIRETIGGPAILTGTPYYLAPLGKRSQTDSRVVDEFKILIGGNEVGHSFNELNDPIDQINRFDAQQKSKNSQEAGFSLDNEYIEALEYAMPPTFGLGISERFFSFLANTSIRNAQIFPLMKPRIDL